MKRVLCASAVHGFKNKKKRKERSTGIIEKGGKKKPVRKEITNSMSGDRVSMKNKDVAQQEEKGKTETKTCEAAAKKKT